MELDETYRLVEECVGIGEIAVREGRYRDVRYAVKRFQAMAPSGMPVPGLHRIEGRLGLDNVAERDTLVSAAVTLRLEDGRSLRLTLIDADGRVLAEGHGPSSCRCC